MSAAPRPGRLVAAARAGETAAALAARRGAPGERPGLRRDLVVRRLVRMGEVTWVVKIPDTQQYYNFTDPEWGVIELFDGTRARAEILEEYNGRYRTQWDLSFILEYEEMLRNIDLVEKSVAERNLTLLTKFKSARQRAAEEKAEGKNIFFLMFHVIDPERFLNRTVKYVRWIWTPPVVVVSSLFFAWTVGVFVTHFGPIWTQTLQLYNFLAKPLLDAVQFFCILSIIGCIHEFGHAYATKIYGGEVHDIGIALLYFTPAFYCDTTDSILFENKWHRLWVNTAGIYVEAFLCSAATFLWVVSYPDTLLNELAYKTMLFTGVSTIFFNINPLIKIDGYYALSAVLEIPELREESFRYLGAWFQKRVLRLPVEIPAASRRKRRIYWIYGPLALLYLGAIMSFITGLFYNFYAKYFPNLAIALLLVTLYRLFRKRVRLVTRTAKLFYLDKKDLLMSPKARRPLLAAAAAVLVLLLVPWTHRKIRAPIILRPLTEVRLQAPEDALVAEVLAGEGETVEAGQPVFRLESPAVQAEGAELSAEKERLEKQASGARQAGHATGVFEAERRAASVDSAIRSDTARKELLLLRSPIEGRVLTPRLADLQRRFARAGDTLAVVGDCRRMRADLEVSERRLDDLAPGERVTALLRGRPFSPARGRIVSLSAATAAQPATVTAGSEPPAPTARPDRFLARAVFENADGSLLPGMEGTAKIYSRRTSPLANAWRVLRRWLQTIVW